MISEFKPKNIMISNFGRKNYRIAKWCVLLAGEFDGISYSPGKCF